MSDKQTATDAEAAEALAEAIESSSTPREQRIIGPDDSPWPGFDKTYTQTPLKFFPKIEFMKLVVDAIKDVMGEDGMSLGELMGVRSVDDITGADVIMQGVLGLASESPDLLKNIYMLALNVPKRDREIVYDLLDYLDDDDGEAIITTFVEQNTAVLWSFFRERAPKVASRVSEILAQTQDSSKPSKRSRANTPRR